MKKEPISYGKVAGILWRGILYSNQKRNNQTNQ